MPSRFHDAGQLTAGKLPGLPDGMPDLMDLLLKLKEFIERW